MIQIEQPKRQISKKAKHVWRISACMELTVGLALFFFLLFLQDTYHWYTWIRSALFVVLAIGVIYDGYKIFIYPVYMQRTWRFSVDEEYVQLKHGVWTQEQTLIPMTKVQYVNKKQGPLLRYFGLSSITIGTTSSTHTIPALEVEEAEGLRMKIAQLAKVGDEK